MLTSFDNIYGFIIKATITGFGFVFTGLCVLLVYLFFDNYLWYIPFIMFGVIVSIVMGSYLNVLLSIPFGLPQKFDAIKNRVAMGKYSNINEFQEDIADFLIKFFNFPGADIIGGKFHFSGSIPLIKNCDFDNIQEVEFKNFKKKIENNMTAFYLPIALGHQNLGYMVLITKGFTLPLFYSILQDFENYYLDDQIMHIAKL